MNNIATIIKYAAKEQFFPFRKDKIVANYPKNYLGRMVTIIINYIVLALVYVFVAGSAGVMYARQPNGEVMYFTMFGILVTLFILTLYIPRMMSDFFSDKDMAIYKTLPLGQGELFMGKFFGAIIGFVDFLIFFAIFLIFYFLDRGFDLGKLAFGLINFPTLVIIPYGLISLILLLIMRFTKLGSHRKVLKTIGYILLFAIMAGIYYYSFNSSNNQPSEDFDRVVIALAGVSDIFFNSKLFGLAMAGGFTNHMKYTLILWAIAGLLSFVLYRLADKLYFASFDSESSKGKERQKQVNKPISLKAGSPMFAIAKRDMKNLFSNIVFITQAVTFVIIFGVMGFSTGRRLIESPEDMEFIFTAEARFWFLMAGLFLAILMWTASSFAGNALSREHKSFYLFQTLPIDSKDHYMARLLSSFLVTEVFNLVLTLIIIGFNKFGFINGLLTFIGMSIGTLIATFIGLYNGTRNININWKKPEELNKGGMRYMVSYFASIIFIGLMIGLVVLIMNLTHSMVFAGIFLIAIIIVLLVISYRMSYEAYQEGFYDV